jgi:phage shock protein C
VNSNQPRRLYRSADDRTIAGVAGGVAEYLNVDPIIVRVLWLISIPLSGGLSALAYLILVVVLPLEGPEWPAGSGFGQGGTPPPTGDSQAQSAPAQSSEPAQAGEPAPSAGPNYIWDTGWRRREHWERHGGSSIGGVSFGALLIIVGGLFVWHEIDPRINLGLVWPLAIIALGVVLVVSAIGFRRGQ